MLPDVDGGIGQENSDGEMTPLLAMLAAPIELTLERGLGRTGDGDLGYPGPADTGDTASGVCGRLFPNASSRTGGPSRRCDRGAVVRLGWVTGGGSMLP